MFNIIKIIKDVLSGLVRKKEVELPFEGLKTSQNKKDNVNTCELTNEQINNIVNDSLDKFREKESNS